MKQIKVNDKCFGCSLCIVNSPYLEENTEGNAEPIPEKAIKSEDIDAINRVIMDCPVGALEIVKTETSNKGKAGVNDVISSLSKKCEAPKIKAVERADVKLNIKNHPISVPYSTKDSRYEYTSEGSAKSAARDEFNRLCYSETAYRPLIKKFLSNIRLMF